MTIAGNSGEIVVRGGGDEGVEGSALTLLNSIIWGNGEREISFRVLPNDCTLTIEYCDIEGGIDQIDIHEESEFVWGEGNIAEDPIFVAPEDGIYYLGEDSPCIDTGDPNSPEDADGSRADMGAYEYYVFGSIGGLVLDFETDEPLEGARVMTEHGFVVQSDEDGHWRIENIFDISFCTSSESLGQNCLFAKNWFA